MPFKYVLRLLYKVNYYYFFSKSALTESNTKLIHHTDVDFIQYVNQIPSELIGSHAKVVLISLTNTKFSNSI